MRCDNCRSKKYPILFTFRFANKPWQICPKCAASLHYTMKNLAPFVVPPKVSPPPRPDPDSLAGRIARKAQELRAQARA